MRACPYSRAALLLVAAVAVMAGCSKNPLAVPPPNPPLSQVILTPDTLRLLVGQQGQITPSALDTLGAPATGVRYAWTAVPAGIFTVTSGGTVTASSEGIALAIASASGRSDTTVVIVDVQSGWYAQASNTTNDLNGVHAAADGRNVWAVGNAGTIVHTSNAGANWATLASNTAFNLNAVWFTSASEGWAAGNSGTIMHTTNASAANASVVWTRMTNVAASENLMDIMFVDAMHGWAVGSGGAILKTRDGGVNWIKKNPTSFQLESVSFSDTSNGWAVGFGGVIVGTHDGGNSWYVVQPAVTGQSLHSVWRRTNTEAWTAGPAGAYAFTTATADSFAWNLSSLGAANHAERLQMVTATTGYVVGQNGGGLVLKTEDGGGLWSPQVSSSAQRLFDVWFVDAERGWAVGVGGRIIHTSRGGE